VAVARRLQFAAEEEDSMHRRYVDHLVDRALAAIRREQRALRAQLSLLETALDRLELHSDAGPVGTLLPGLRLRCRDHFLGVEALAHDLLGAGRVEPPQPVHGDLDVRLGELEGLLARADQVEGRDDLWRAGHDLVRVLSCHLCRAEHGLLPMLDQAAAGVPPEALPAPPCPPCPRW
jgi:hypothetical protein